MNELQAILKNLRFGETVDAEVLKGGDPCTFQIAMSTKKAAAK